jgi:hypothetical protein
LTLRRRGASNPHGSRRPDGRTEKETTIAGRRARARGGRARRAAREQSRKDAPNEVGGRGGLDPARYGDWETNGIASDF